MRGRRQDRGLLLPGSRTAIGRGGTSNPGVQAEDIVMLGLLFVAVLAFWRTRG